MLKRRKPAITKPHKVCMLVNVDSLSAMCSCVLFSYSSRGLRPFSKAATGQCCISELSVTMCSLNLLSFTVLHS